MLNSVPFMHKLVPALGAVLMLAVPSATVAGSSAAATSMQVWPSRDPALALDLALAYQKDGRMDFAQPLYCQAMSEGKNVPAPATANASNSGKTVAEIASANLRKGLHARVAC